jgi:hypothetical protein
MISTEKYGYWAVLEKKFFNKFEALLYATEHNQPVKFVYHHNVWENFDRTKLGKVPLNVLYKDRAQQLRDTYDYLILYFSGGADSFNILKTFLDNNIKLDEVCVKWPQELVDGKFYTPNTVDKTAKNCWSEWDFAIKPVLKQLTTDHPTIKIKIQNYIENITTLNVDAVFDKVNFVRGVSGMLFNSTISESEKLFLDNGKKVAHIYGIDKPLLWIDKSTNQLYMRFTDATLDQLGRGSLDDLSGECFYWSPECPLLTFEMAYQVANHYRHNISDRKYLLNYNLPNLENEIRAKVQHQNDLGRSVLYNNWTDRFQADKPISSVRVDRFSWAYSSELNKNNMRFFGMLRDRTRHISSRLLTSPKPFSPSVYANLSSEGYYITTL